MTTTNTQNVTIECPRCDGAGRRQHWNPDAGICYRCKGRCSVTINVPRHKAALRHLRAKFCRLRAEAQAGCEQAQEALSLCVQDGRSVRNDLEAAGVAV